MGAEPCRLGSAKLLFPSPPYMVPSSEKRAVFWLMGMSWPLHSAQPVGAKFPAKILISATNGFDMAIFSPLLILAGENSLQRDDEIQHQVRAHVFMRLAASSGQHACRVHGHIGAAGKRHDIVG